MLRHLEDSSASLSIQTLVLFYNTSSHQLSLAFGAHANGTEAWELSGLSKLCKILFFLEQSSLKRGLATQSKWYHKVKNGLESFPAI